MGVLVMALVVALLLPALVPLLMALVVMMLALARLVAAVVSWGPGVAGHTRRARALQRFPAPSASGHCFRAAGQSHARAS